jgi:hypothetical protein
MGAERDAQNSYPGWKRFPKLIMTGGLTGTLDGLPVEITATDDVWVTLKISRLKSVFSLLRCRKSFGGLLPPLRAIGISAAVELPGKIRLQLAPAPGPLVQWLLGG